MGNEKSTSSYIPLTPIIGEKVGDDTYILRSKDIKNINDTLYYMAKMIQGGLNLANLNTAANQVFTDMAGNITEVEATAQGLTTRVSSAEGNIVTAQQTASSASVTASNALGEAQQVKLTVDGLSVADETGSYTIIDGDKIVSKDHATNGIVEIKDGNLSFKNGTTLLGEITPDSLGMYLATGTGKWIYLDGNVQVGLYNTVGVNGSTIVIQSGTTLKLVAGTNMAIDSSGTIYIGASYGQSGNVNIGQAGGAVNLNGSVYINGVLQ